MYKLNLKLKGRYKSPYYNIIIVNKNNKFVEKIGGYNPLSLKRKIQINLFVFYCWLIKHIKISFFICKFLKLIFL